MFTLFSFFNPLWRVDAGRTFSLLRLSCYGLKAPQGRVLSGGGAFKMAKDGKEWNVDAMDFVGRQQVGDLESDTVLFFGLLLSFLCCFSKGFLL